MVPPTINRKRGPTLEQRRRALGRMKKKNRIAAGKAKAPPKGNHEKRTPGAKKLKKREQRARLLAKSRGDLMED